MNRHSKVFLPRVNKTIISRHTRGAKQGKGIGAVLLDNGIQSSYDSIDEYIATTNANPLVSVSGQGLKGLEKIRAKMENLVIKPTSRKPKNIKFTL